MESMPETNPSEELFIQKFKKEMLGIIAQKITLSLFEKGDEEEIKNQISELVDNKIRRDGVEIAAHLHDKIIDDIIAGLPIKRADPAELQPTATAGPDINQAKRLHKAMAPYLATNLDDSLFQPGRESLLEQALTNLVDRKLSNLDERLTPETRDELLKMVLEKIFGGQATRLATTSVPMAVATEVPQQDDEDLRRELLFFVATHMDISSVQQREKDDLFQEVCRLIDSSDEIDASRFSNAMRSRFVSDMIEGKNMEFRL